MDKFKHKFGQNMGWASFGRFFYKLVWSQECTEGYIYPFGRTCHTKTFYLAIRVTRLGDWMILRQLDDFQKWKAIF
jgi:hypothetical protein